MLKIYLSLLLIFICITLYPQSVNYASVNQKIIHLFTTNHLKEAKILVDSALEKLTIDDKNPDSAKFVTLYYASMLYNDLESYDRAEYCIQKLNEHAKYAFPKGSWAFFELLELNRDLMSRLNNYSQVIFFLRKQHDFLKESLQSDEKLSGFQMQNVDRMYKRYRLTVCTYGLGFMYAKSSDYKKAKIYIEEAKLYLDKDYTLKNDPQSFVNNSIWEANFLLIIDELEPAEQIFLNAEEWMKNYYTEDHPLYAQLLVSQAGFYKDINKNSAAIEIYLKAKKILDNTFQKQSGDYCEILKELGKNYLDNGNISKAEGLFMQAFKIVSANPDNYINNFISIKLSLADLYLRKNDIISTELTYASLDSFFNTKANKFFYHYSDFIIHKANFFSKESKYYEADSLYSLFLRKEELKSGNSSSDYGSALLQKAKNFWKWGKVDGAIKTLLQSIAISKKVIERYFAFFSESQKQDYLSSFNQDYNFLYHINSIYKDNNLIKTAFEIQSFLKGLLLKTSVFTNIKRTITPLQEELFKLYVQLKKQIASGYLASSDMNVDLYSLEQKAEQMEKKLSKMSFSALQQQYNVFSSKEVSSDLKKGEAFVDFFHYNFNDSVFYGCFIITRKNPKPFFKILFEEKQILPLLNSVFTNSNLFINSLYNAEKDIPYNTNRTRENKLYTLVWKAIEEKLGGIHTVFISPSGLLNKVSFYALFSKDKYLMDKHSIRIISDLKTALQNANNKTNPATFKAAVYGGIDYDTDSTTLKSISLKYKYSRNNNSLIDRGGNRYIKSWEYLPGTNEEVKSISVFFKNRNVSIYKGKYATEESFKALSNQAPEIIHIATHGFFFSKKNKDEKSENSYSEVFKKNENPLFRSGLIFSGANFSWKNGKSLKGSDDGILTGYEISLLNLSNTKLAILSACETGLGDIENNEGVYGLQRAFKMAGVQNLVMSLWRVPDLETSEFMKLFYKNLFAGHSINDAFYYTQATMKNKYKSEAYKWAAWILVR